MIKIGNEIVQHDFLEEVSRLSKAEIVACYQCGKCSAGCPMAGEMDILPNQVMRYIQLNMRESLLASKGFWACVSCAACSTRCPKSIDIAGVMDTLRILATSRRRESDRSVAAFNRVFLDTIRKYGRLNELELAGLFSLKTLTTLTTLTTLRPFRDLALAPKLYKKGKIVFDRQKVKDIGSVERIFAKVRPFGPKAEAKEGRE